MGRDYPVERVLERLYESGFAQGSRASRRVVEFAAANSHPCGAVLSHWNSSGWAGIILSSYASHARAELRSGCRASRVAVEPRFSSLPGKCCRTLIFRMGRDSNPGFRLRNTRFPSVRNRPLCHPSNCRAVHSLSSGRWQLMVAGEPTSDSCHARLAVLRTMAASWDAISLSFSWRRCCDFMPQVLLMKLLKC